VPAQIQRAATQQLLTNWPADLGAPPGAAEVTEVLAYLLAGILEAQVTDSAVIDSRVHSALGRQLLIALRAELVRDWKNAGVDETELAPLLAACERVHRARCGRVARSGMGSFALCPRQNIAFADRTDPQENSSLSC